MGVGLGTVLGVIISVIALKMGGGGDVHNTTIINNYPTPQAASQTLEQQSPQKSLAKKTPKKSGSPSGLNRKQRRTAASKSRRSKRNNH
jgi:hypothetical protein